MRAFPRLLRYLRPYGGRLTVAVLCMALYAAFSGLTIGLFSPFLQILFAPATANVTAVHGAASPAAGAGLPGAAAQSLLAQARWGSLDRWPHFLRAPLEETRKLDPTL